MSEVNEVASQTTAAMKKAKKQSGIQLLMTKTTALTPDGTSEEHAVLFFDGGSQRSYMKRELMKKLGLRPQRYEKLSLYTFASAKPQHVTAPVVQFDLKQKNGTLTRMEVCVLPQLVNPIQTQTLEPGDLQVIQSSLGWNTEELKGFQGKLVDVDILIGSDYYYNFIGHQPNLKLPSGRVIVPSTFGYLLGGKYDSEEGKADYQIYSEENRHYEDLTDTSQNAEEFWDLNTIGIKSSAEVGINTEQIAMQQFEGSNKVEEILGMEDHEKVGTVET